MTKSMRATTVDPRHRRRASSQPQHTEDVHNQDNEDMGSTSRLMLTIPRPPKYSEQKPAHMLARILALSKRHNIEYKKHASPVRLSVASQPATLAIATGQPYPAQPSPAQQSSNATRPQAIEHQNKAFASELIASKASARRQTSVFQDTSSGERLAGRGRKVGYGHEQRVLPEETAPARAKAKEAWVHVSDGARASRLEALGKGGVWKTAWKEKKGKAVCGYEWVTWACRQGPSATAGLGDFLLEPKIGGDA